MTPVTLGAGQGFLTNPERLSDPYPVSNLLNFPKIVRIVSAVAVEAGKAASEDLSEAMARPAGFDPFEDEETDPIGLSVSKHLGHTNVTMPPQRV